VVPLEDSGRHGLAVYGAGDVLTGERKWHFQITHHGLWDYDLPATLNLVTIRVRDKGDKLGNHIDAVAQVTSQNQLAAWVDAEYVQGGGSRHTRHRGHRGTELALSLRVSESLSSLCLCV
jgi:hypothetical protein